jgi:serine/threonine protein kinase
MSGYSACPSEDLLQRLLGESLPAGDQTELIAHLDACSNCQHRLEKLAGVDHVLLDSAITQHQPSYVRELTLQRVLAHLKSDNNATMVYVPQDRMLWVQSLLDQAGPSFSFEGYEAREFLGQGAMGLVLKAFEPALKRWVAIKVLAPDLADDLKARQRFAREAQAAAAVRHENVITIHAVSETNGLPHLVMEYVEGGSLQDFLDLNGPPDWPAVARLGAEVAAGLAAAHATGLVHRDIKPSNILLQQDGPPNVLGRAKICDFGLARAADETRLTLSGTVMGTPMYMAPEQARCEPLDERADLFSLGSVLYTLSTGHEPFPVGSPVAVLRQVCETSPRPVRELNPAIPLWLASVIERLHAKLPADRFSSAAEVAELLRYNLRHPDHPRLVRTPFAVIRARNKRRFLWGAAVVALLITGSLALSESLHWTHLRALWAGAEVQNDRIALRATLRGHTGPVMTLAFAPDGQTLATGSDDSTLRLWDVQTTHEKARLGAHDSAVLFVTFARSGKFFISGGADGTLRVWDAATHQEQEPLPHNSSNLRRAPLSPDGRTVALASSSQGVELWDLESRSFQKRLGEHLGTVQAMAFATDGGTLATGDARGIIRLWNPTSGEELANFAGDALGIRALAFSPDSKTLASAGTGDKEVKLWDVSNQQLLATLAGNENGAPNLTFSPDGRLIAAGSRSGVVSIWEVSTAQILAAVEVHKGFVWAVAFSPDGQSLATCGDDRLAKLWDLSRLEQASP